MGKRVPGAKRRTRQVDPYHDRMVLTPAMRAEAEAERHNDRYDTLEDFLGGLFGLDPAGIDEPVPRALVERVQRLTRGRVIARQTLCPEALATGEILADLLGRDALEVAFYATQAGDPLALTHALLAGLDRLEQHAGLPS